MNKKCISDELVLNWFRNELLRTFFPFSSCILSLNSEVFDSKRGFIGSSCERWMARLIRPPTDKLHIRDTGSRCVERLID